MKEIIKVISLIFIAMLAFTACDDDDEGGTPLIHYVRSTDPAASDSLLVSASMGQTIALIGENLQDVVSIYFNDQEARLNPTLITSSSIIVDVPGSIPSVVTNTISLTTSGGISADYNFTTRITPPSLTSISCEWAQDGSEVILYGSYFFPKSDASIDVLFPGNLTGEVVEFTDNTITVEVPTGALQGFITVSNDYGTGKSSFIFRDDRGIFIDGENPGVWNAWGLSDFATDGGIDGQYINFEGSTGDWAWPANSIQVLYMNPDAQPLLTEGDVEDYALKFEVYCHEWHDTPMLIWFDNTGAHNVDGPEAQYHWKAYDNNGVSENYVTDGWITVTMPLADFVYSKDESETDRKINSLSEIQNLNMMWFGPAFETTTEFGLKMWIDNLRLVPVN